MSIFNLTRKADYGLMMLSELAQKGEGGLVSIHKMSVDRGLPKPFLAQIGQSLAKAGIVGSKEGRNGGYFLKFSPKEVKIKTALEAIEGPVAPALCIHEKGACPLEDHCTQKTFMSVLTKDMHNLLNSYSLEDLVKN